ncbi:zinc/manganese transport system permease protein [Sulfuritortus calidifontis]|uniref:Zinc/manganese transport system permease protein n=1 Tax=Sulfuritortus calidifontis TaxID=1914471 RepID=A0A4R3JRD0_9PROT|nr:metal ABC transporter permease [Sulfuritortus calidifontis]TCS69464.1 zinc/manganese transport system permease protein [Sulfuritortus calidifontis]
MNWQLDLPLLAAPWLAGLLVLASHVPLGREVLRRGVVFVDLAVAQIAGLGVIAAHALGWEPAGWRVQAAAFGAALVGAGLLAWLERRWPHLAEPLIGVGFVLAASLAALVSAHDPHGGEHLRDLLVGQILWVNWPQVAWLGLLTGLALLAWRVLQGRRWGFYPVLALCVTASVQVVGVWLVFASLILPALAVGRRRGGAAWGIGLGLGALGYGAGLALSAWLDWPAGAVIVLMLALCALFAARIIAASRND